MEAADINLIEACKRGKPSAQREVYTRFSPMMFAVALRYTNGRADAEDIFARGVDQGVPPHQVVQRTQQFRRMAAANRRQHRDYALPAEPKTRFQLDVDEVHATPADLEAFKELDFTREELATAIAQLPKGYGMVFNMYVIEGYKHKEIAEQLGIDLNTSKSQLSRARKYFARHPRKHVKASTEGIKQKR